MKQNRYFYRYYFVAILLFLLGIPSSLLAITTFNESKTKNITVYVGDEIRLYYSRISYNERHYEKNTEPVWSYSSTYFEETQEMGDFYSIYLRALQECTNQKISFTYSYYYKYYPTGSVSLKTQWVEGTITWYITVIPRPAPEAVSLSQSIIDIPVGSKYQLNANIIPEDAFQTVDWYSNASEIASVDDMGLITANEVGDAVISAVSTVNNTIMASCNVHVGSTDVQTITIPEKLLLHYGDTMRFVPEITPSYAYYDLNWQSSDETVATVDQKGAIETIGPGTTEITVTDLLTNTQDKCVLSVYIENGDTFKSNISHNELGVVSATLMITDLENKIVSIGDGNVAAIPTSSTGGIVLPSTVAGPGNITYKVNSIASNAFKGCCLMSVTIPQEIQSIGDNAFNGCRSLTNVNVSWDYPISISSSCFPYAASISLNIPRGSYETYKNAPNWNMFKTIAEPPHLENDLFTISVTAGNSKTDMCFKVIDVANKYVGVGNGERPSIPDYTNEIVVIPSTVMGYDGQTYQVTQLLPGAFFDCYEMTGVQLPNTITSIGQAALYGCSSLTTFTIPPLVSLISDDAFSGCTQLKSINIPASVVGLGDGVFYGCSQLTSVTVNWNVPIAIGNDCFSNAGNATLNIPKGSYNKYVLADNWKSFKIIKEPAHDVGDVFVRDVHTTGIDAHGQFRVVSISPLSVSLDAVKDYQEGTTLIIDGAVQGYDGMIYTVAELDALAFDGCNLSGISIPKIVTTIGNNTFDSCDAMMVVSVGWHDPLIITDEYFPNASNAILEVPYGSKTNYEIAEGWKLFKSIIEKDPQDDDLFQEKNADDIDIWFRILSAKERTCEIKENAISTGITGKLLIPNKVRDFDVVAIGTSAFQNCTHISIVEIPQEVTAIGSMAFNGCNDLNSVSVEWDEPIEIGSNCFSNVNNATLYVPIGTNKKYRTAIGWKDFGVIANKTNSTIFAEDVIACRGGRVILPIHMNNVEDIQQLQFELSLPSNVSVVLDEQGDPLASLTQRASDTHIISGTLQPNGNYQFQVILKTVSNNIIQGNEGRIATIPLKVYKAKDPGVAKITIADGVLSVKDESQGLHLSETESDLTVSDVMLGDTNNDERVNVVDISNIINYILGKNIPDFVKYAANASGDERISVADISTIIDIILGKTVFGEKQATKKEELDPQ